MISAEGGSRDLPLDLLQQASRRFQLICLIGIALWGVNLFIFRVVAPALCWMCRDEINGGKIDIVVAVLIAFSALLY